MRYRVFAIVSLSVPAILCTVWLMQCPLGTACLSPTGASSLLPMMTLLLIAIPVAAWAGRTGWLLASAHRAVRRLQIALSPTTLEAAAARTQLPIACIEGSVPAAFATGVLRPRIVVTTALLQSLQADQVDAVLWHEARHVARRDPLRRAMLRALSEVYFCVPAIRGWMEQQLVASELAADRAAIERVGRRAVAQALLTVRDIPFEAVAAFAGTAEARVAQLLGDPIAPTPLPRSLWLLSTAGGASILALAWCTAHLLASI
ncbi:MAG: M56 family metallopeptidase [Candidatus Dormibacteraeota bacterium]|nr:M56 family metallopeptidase [Candidatus Dormibacteraeota bacterium]